MIEKKKKMGTGGEKNSFLKNLSNFEKVRMKRDECEWWLKKMDMKGKRLFLSDLTGILKILADIFCYF